MKQFKTRNQVVWLASYPRSGNTFLRTILWQCFGFRTGSVYGSDLGGNHELHEYVGHIEHTPEGKLTFPIGSPALIKTHALNTDEHPAIYVIRDGRAACTSLRHFYKNKFSLDSIVDGATPFGTWGQHVKSWHPWDRKNTLLLKYEDLVSDLPSAIIQIGVFLNREPIRESVPDRSAIARIDGKWVKPPSTWQSEFASPLLMRFNQENGDMLKKFGYLPGSSEQVNRGYKREERVIPKTPMHGRLASNASLI